MAHISKNLVDLITVPYDSGHLAKRMGAGPVHLVKSGMVERLESSKVTVRHEQIAVQDNFETEIATTFELLEKIKTRVTSSLKDKSFPIIVSGNCNASVGVLAAFDNSNTGLIWFDAHADCETPETTRSGFLDGMAMSMIQGKCWRNKMSVLNSCPIPGNHIVLIGARDLSESEKDLVYTSQIQYITVAAIRQSPSCVRDAIARLANSGLQNLHIHLDVDVFDPSVAPSNSYCVANGLLKEEVMGAIRECANKIPLRSAALAAYDPSFDVDGKMVALIFEIMQVFASLAFKDNKC